MITTQKILKNPLKPIHIHIYIYIHIQNSITNFDIQQPDLDSITKHMDSLQNPDTNDFQYDNQFL